jgi:DNA repair exonuclease SbcCD nuclease subunit
VLKNEKRVRVLTKSLQPFTMKVLCVGDLHIQRKNINMFQQFEKEFLKYLDNNVDTIDIVVFLGDVLHTMDVVHTFCMNLALEFFKKLQKYGKPIYVLVGNHDFIGPNEYMTHNHWMSNICFHDCIRVIDTATLSDGMVFMPYVPPGRFHEAIDTVHGQYNYIFCHQEFKGAEFEFSETAKSEGGDTWEQDRPRIVSGHIHKKQFLQKNIYYTGTPYQTRFNEDEDKTIALIDTETNAITEIDLHLPKMCMLYKDLADMEHMLNYPFDSRHVYKICITSPSLQETQLFMRQYIYKTLKAAKNISIVFRYTAKEPSGSTPSVEPVHFKERLYSKIKHNGNMVALYKELFAQP